MKIQILSDLHLEAYSYKYDIDKFRTDADMLILAGDICKAKDALYWVSNFARTYKYCIYIPGNHEYYGGDWNDNVFSHFEDELPNNVFFTEFVKSVKIEDITFIFGPLWTNFNDNPIAEQTASRYINDFRGAIKNFSIDVCRNFGNYSRFTFMSKILSNPGKKVVISHFLPALECVQKKWWNDPTSSVLNHYFSNNMGKFIVDSDVNMWVYGHTHDPDDFMLNNTRMITNPMGYPKEISPAFQEKLIVTV